ncbi:MAG: gamma carbonic anhydrase family protein [Cyclobacteriaceae bacterium]|nr:MAG: gamma carbonic anhydrase family protein [Cyclobacteriaceae bacterium]
MALIKPVNGIQPVIGEGCFLAENATIVGEVILGDQCSVWFQAVLRGDVNSIHIGALTNIQDGVVIHGTYQKAATVIGQNVSIGHNAIIHGCTIEDGALVGMGAIVLDHAVIGKGALIAAGSVVLSGTKVTPGMLYAGTPAKEIKPVDDKLKEVLVKTPGNYLKYASWYH